MKTRSLLIEICYLFSIKLKGDVEEGVIDLKQKQKIILAHLNGVSNREIARSLHKSKDTINKYVNEYEEKRAELLAQDPMRDPTEIIQAFVEEPKYDSSNRGPKESTEEAMAEIEECLKLNEAKRAMGMGKQQMKKIDIHAYLRKKGYDISYSTVKRLTREIETRHEEAFIRQEYEPGHTCEFDWGTVKLDIGGTGYKKYQMAVFTAAYSNNRYAKLYQSQDTAAFQESHADYFAYCHGVFHQMTYDNMKVAVKRFVGPTEKEPTEALLQLSLYYGFKFRFCNIYSGNEKGHVERSVEYVRRKAFSAPGCDVFNTLEEANAFLYRECMKLNATDIYNDTIPAETFKEERTRLLPAMPKFECCIKTTGKVDKYSTVTVARNHYSVPDTLVGKKLDIRIYTDKIIVYHDGKAVARHTRSFRPHDWQIDIYHYLRTLKRKPGALRQSMALLQSDALVKKIYDDYYSSEPKTFLEVLEIIYEKGAGTVLEGLRRLAAVSPMDLSADKVRVVCDKIKDEKQKIRPGTDRLSEKSKSTLSQYDRLREMQCEAERMAV